MGAVAAFLLVVQQVGSAGPMMAVVAIATKLAVVRMPELAVVRTPMPPVAMVRAPELVEARGPVMSHH